LNRNLSVLRCSSLMTLDDDHINYVGIDKDIPNRMDKRKGNGFTFNTQTDIVCGLATSTYLVSNKMPTPFELTTELDMSEGVEVVVDRGFARLELASYLKTRNIGMLGILPGFLKADHPASLIIIDYDQLQTLDADTLPANAVISFPGVGMQCSYWKRSDGVMAISVINRSKTCENGGHIRFLGSGRIMKEENASLFMRVHKPTSRTVLQKTLIGSMKARDDVAKTLFAMISDKLRFVTLLQGTADWFVLRRTGLTASMASTVVKPPTLRFQWPVVHGPVPHRDL